MNCILLGSTTTHAPLLFSDKILPEELILHVFSFLEIRDLGTCSLVSKQWKRIAEDNGLWKRKLLKEIGFSSVAISEGNNIKKQLGEIAILSIDKLIEKLNLFLNTICLHQNGEFNCHFPLLSGNSYIYIKLAFGLNVEPSLPINGEAHYIFLGKCPSIFFHKLIDESPDGFATIWANLFYDGQNDNEIHLESYLREKLINAVERRCEELNRAAFRVLLNDTLISIKDFASYFFSAFTGCSQHTEEAE